MHPANQRPRKPDKLSQGAHNQTCYPKIQWENTLDKKGGHRTPKNEMNLHAQQPWGNPERLEVIGEHKVKEQEQEHMTTHATGS